MFSKSSKRDLTQTLSGHRSVEVLSPSPGSLGFLGLPAGPSSSWGTRGIEPGAFWIPSLPSPMELTITFPPSPDKEPKAQHSFGLSVRLFGSINEFPALVKGIRGVRASSEVIHHTLYSSKAGGFSVVTLMPVRLKFRKQSRRGSW